MTKPPTCTYDAVRGWCTPEHLRDCADGQCRGCRPCAEDHCELNGRCGNHVEHDAGIYTCPSCIGKVKRNVRQIVDRYAELPEEIEAKGVDSEALNLHGPAASAEQLAARRRWELSRGWCDFPRTLAADDPHHPYAVLGRWDLAMRESYGPATDLFITISRAADYLTGPVIEQFAHTREFEDFARDVSRCLAHLETVLSDSREPEKGAPCPTCRDEQPAEKAPRLRKRYGADVRGKDDTWHCPIEPAHWWSETDYRTRIDGDYLLHARALTASQMHEAHGIKPGTLRQWANRGTVAKRGRSTQGQQLYDVAQARAAKGDTLEAAP